MFTFNAHPPILQRLCWCGLTLALAAALWSVLPTITQAQATIDPPARTVTFDEINAVAREIWCPLCSGVRLDACELKACDQMKDVIALKLAEGEDTAAIKAYFLEQYGPQILGEPPRTGFNWLAWILPFAALLGGGVFVWFRARQMFRPALPEAAPPGSLAARQTPDQPQDEYERKLEEELQRYG